MFASEEGEPFIYFTHFLGHGTAGQFLEWHDGVADNI